jgi:hypothetical protein
MARDCQVECGLTRGGIDYFAPPDAAAECQGCLGTTDCAAERACASSVECVAYAQCLHTCWTPDCRLACATATDGGWIDPDAGVNAARVPYASVIDPTATCNTACAVGNNWTCLGHVSWPMVTTGGTTLTTTVIDQLGSAPVVGAEVSLCRFTDPTCSAPIKSAISDQNGNVTLDIPGTVLGIGSDDYVQITSPDGNVVPTLDFLGYPVSRPRAPIAEPYATVLSPTELTTLASLLGIDAGLASIYGIAAFEVFDCNGLPSPGATVSIEPMAPQAVPFILTPGETPTTTATATTSIGVGGFAAVPPGTVTLTATPQGMRESSSRAQLLVRAGTDSIIYLFPTT